MVAAPLARPSTTPPLPRLLFLQDPLLPPPYRATAAQGRTVRRLCSYLRQFRTIITFHLAMVLLHLDTEHGCVFLSTDLLLQGLFLLEWVSLRQIPIHLILTTCIHNLGTLRPTRMGRLVLVKCAGETALRDKAPSR